MEKLSQNLEALKDEYGDLDSFIEALIEDESYRCKYEDECLWVYISQIDEYIKIHKSQLYLITECKEANKIPSMKYLDSYGFKFKNYHEICLNINNPYTYISFGEDMRAWPGNILTFMVADTKFEVGPMSKLMVLLMENIYSDNNSAHYQFDDYYPTMKIVVPESKDYKEEFCKGLFYLNSHYMKKSGFQIKLNRLELDNNYFFEDESEPLTDVESFKYVLSSNETPHCDYVSLEPLKLYIEASNKEGEQKFLLLYRILEFFIWRAILQKIKDVRNETSISEEEIFEVVNMHNDAVQLNNLLKECLSTDEKNEITEFCMETKLIDVATFPKVCENFYQYRNSLVHAKETEIHRINIPDPFAKEDQKLAWIKVVDQIALNCIEKYNQKEDLV